jgi:predicted Zn-dependent peptidase
VLGKWQNTEKPAARSFSNELPNPTSARIFLMDRPGSAQADFRIGGLAIKRSDDDYFPLVVANAILGAGTNSRLFLNIREKKGYAYDVFSSIDALRQAGTFFGGAETRTEVTVAAIKEMLAEFDKLRTGEVGSVELQDAKNYINGLFSLSLSTQGGVAERVLQTYMFELGRDYLETYRSHIESVTAEDVRRVAGKYLVPNRATTVVVGDASRLKRELNSIGAVTVVGNSN